MLQSEKGRTVPYWLVNSKSIIADTALPDCLIPGTGTRFSNNFKKIPEFLTTVPRKKELR